MNYHTKYSERLKKVVDTRHMSLIYEVELLGLIILFYDLDQYVQLPMLNFNPFQSIFFYD